jgi:transglutaminase-like putative cysteine protease
MLAALAALLAALFLLTACSSLQDVIGGGDGGGSHVEGPPRDTTPVVLEATQPGAAIVSDDKATLDFSNAAEGYICAKNNLGDAKIKVLVDVAEARYQYTIEPGTPFVTIPLSQGNGSYVVGVWEHVIDNEYSAIFSQTIDVVLSDALRPFLYPSQFVSFSAGDEATALSQQLAEGSVTDVDALNGIYNWVCKNVVYDTQKATTVASGYLPNNSNTINSKQGICFDYAVLTASMLRAQRVPCKLVVGYAGQAYHAWINVYSIETGKVLSYTFNGNEWVEMDPTFDAAAGGSLDLSAVIGNGTNYQPMFYY